MDQIFGSFHENKLTKKHKDNAQPNECRIKLYKKGNFGAIQISETIYTKRSKGPRSK